MRTFFRGIVAAAAIVAMAVGYSFAQNPGPILGPNGGLTGHPWASAGPGANTPPSAGTCGTGTVAAGSTDFAGNATATGATACTITFGTPFLVSPICVAKGNTTSATAGIVVVNTTVSFTISGLTSGDTFSWICVGRGAP